MIFYLDSSALAKQYAQEADSEQVRRRLKLEQVATSRLSEIEIGSAIARRAREDQLSAVERDRMLSRMRADFTALAVVELTPEIAAMAVQLLARHPLRAGDAIQLASCLYLRRGSTRAVAFMGFDDRLNQAARREGLALAADY